MSPKSVLFDAYLPWRCQNDYYTANTALVTAYKHHVYIVIAMDVFSLISKKTAAVPVDAGVCPFFIIIRWSNAHRHCCPFALSMLNMEASNAYGMPEERSLAASSCVAVFPGVRCDPPSSSLSLLSPWRCNLCRCLSLVSARRGPQTRLLICLSSSPLSCSLPPLSAASGTHPCHQLACHHCP